MASKKRVSFLDTARALCMLWIVGIWHMETYLSCAISVHNQITGYVTIGVLATFTFISGFFLGGGIDSFSGAVIFYKKRVKRFYLLFVLSCVSLYVMHEINNDVNFIVSLKQLICTITGLVCFINSMPLTVWYFSMMILFYLVTPFITSQKNLKRKVVASIAIYFFLVLTTNLFVQTDTRVVLYFPIYSVALMCSEKVHLNERFNVKIFGIAFAGSIVAVWLSLIGQSAHLIANYLALITNYITQLVPATFIGITIIEVSKLVTTKETDRAFGRISYASMCAYLFHRQFFHMIKYIFGDISLILAYCVFLPLFLVGCFWCQKAYDFIFIGSSLRCGVK